jgi:hypothetical protein
VLTNGYEAAVRGIAAMGPRERVAALRVDGIESVLVEIDGVTVGRLADDDACELEALVLRAALEGRPLGVRAVVTATETCAMVTLVGVPEASPRLG